MPITTLDATDLGALGFRVVDDSGFDDQVDRSYPTVNPGGLGGQIRASARATYNPRKGTMTLVRRDTSLSALRTALDGLYGRLASPGVVVRNALRPNRLMTIRVDGGIRTVPLDTTKYVNAPWYYWKGTLPYIADDPFWYEESTTATAFTTATNLVIGSGPVMVDVEITGPCVNPLVELLDLNSIVRLSAAPIITLASGEKWRIKRTQPQAIQYYTGGVWTDWWANMPIVYDFFEIREEWWNYGTSAWSKLRVTAASGSPTGIATIPNRWS